MTHPWVTADMLEINRVLRRPFLLLVLRKVLQELAVGTLQQQELGLLLPCSLRRFKIFHLFFGTGTIGAAHLLCATGEMIPCCSRRYVMSDFWT